MIFDGFQQGVRAFDRAARRGGEVQHHRALIPFGQKSAGNVAVKEQRRGGQQHDQSQWKGGMVKVEAKHPPVQADEMRQHPAGAFGLSGDQRGGQGRGQEHCQQHRDRDGDGQGAGERPEKDPRHPPEELQRDEHHQGGQGRAGQGSDDLSRTLDHRFGPGKSLFQIALDVLHHHDGVIHQDADGGSQPSQTHQVQVHPGQFHEDKGDQQRHRDDQGGDQSDAQPAQEQQQDQHGQPCS